jgi:hypothetical protein
VIKGEMRGAKSDGGVTLLRRNSSDDGRRCSGLQQGISLFWCPLWLEKKRGKGEEEEGNL